MIDRFIDGVWPWDHPQQKDTADRRSQLLMAGALILAEVERMDNATN